MVSTDIDPQFTEYRNVLSQKLLEDMTLANQKAHVRSISVRTGQNTHIETVGEYIPDPLRQDINLGDLSIKKCKRVNRNGTCLVFARLKVVDSDTTDHWDPNNAWD